MRNFLTILLVGIGISAFSQPCLIGHWPLDSNAYDISGNGFHGTVYGATPEIGRMGIPNTAYRFDGVNDYINIAHDTAFDFSVNDEFSISLWVMIDNPQDTSTLTGGSNTIISKWEDTSNFNADYPFEIRLINQYHIDSGRITGHKRSRVCLEEPYVLSKSTIIDSTFHHILFTRSLDDSLRLFMDGILESTEKDLTTCATNNIADLEFGWRGGKKNPSYFKGVIDDVKIFGCALTPDKILGTDIEDNQNLKQINLYPNPAFDVLNFNLDGNQNATYSIFNSMGSIMQSGKITDNFVRIESIPAGQYLIRITVGEEYIGQRFIKN